MIAYVFSSQAGANACQVPVDSNQGYPAVGIDIGGGIHVIPTFVTVTYYVPLKHPVNAQWAYISDAISNPPLQAQSVALSLPAAIALDSTWFPAPAAVIVTGP